MSKNFFLEVCVDSVESAVAAGEGGAARVELCANVKEGGTTPSAGMIKLVRANISIGLNIMIRPRAGDFCYTDKEFAVMKEDVTLAKRLGADGVVFGMLRSDGSLDSDRLRTLLDLARPMSVTFHRAFDATADLPMALEEIVSLGINRVLTSGGQETALEGIEMIRRLVQQVRRRVQVMAGSGVNERNVGEIIKHGDVEEVHVMSAVSFLKRSRAGGQASFDKDIYVVDPKAVRRFVELGSSSLFAMDRSSSTS